MSRGGEGRGGQAAIEGRRGIAGERRDADATMRSGFSPSRRAGVPASRGKRTRSSGRALAPRGTRRRGVAGGVRGVGLDRGAEKRAARVVASRRARSGAGRRSGRRRGGETLKRRDIAAGKDRRRRTVCRPGNALGAPGGDRRDRKGAASHLRVSVPSTRASRRVLKGQARGPTAPSRTTAQRMCACAPRANGVPADYYCRARELDGDLVTRTAHGLLS